MDEKPTLEEFSEQMRNFIDECKAKESEGRRMIFKYRSLRRSAEDILLQVTGESFPQERWNNGRE